MMYTMLEEITPKKAAKWLEQNDQNRPLRMETVKSMVRDIRGGNWKTTHQGIAFDTNGRLIDGQHRLKACVVANVPIMCNVTYGVCPDGVAAIDIGTKRSFVDNMTIQGRHADSPWMRSTHMHAAIRTLFRCQYHSGLKLSDYELDRFMCDFRDDLECIYHATGCAQGLHSGIVASLFAAKLCGEPVKGITAFAKVIRYNEIESAAEYNVAPALSLNRQIMAAKAKHERVYVERLVNICMNALWAFLHSSSIKLVKETPTRYRYDVSEILKKWMEGEKNVD